MAGKVAIVTGGGTGIGRASALALGRDGYSVVIAGRRPDPLEQTASAAAAEGSQLVSMVVDVTNPVDVLRLFDQTWQQFGRVDVLFNNAGTFGHPAPIDEFADAEWRTVIDSNLTGSFFCAREAFRTMKAQDPQGGRIINNGSISAHAPRPNSAPYTATKHAITGLTKSAALDGRKYDIACGQIDIGNAATEMTARMKQGVPQANGSIAVEPTMDPEHVASAVVYMASLPPEANVQFLTVMATKMPVIGRG